jgi:hypothetical protein
VNATVSKPTPFRVTPEGEPWEPRRTIGNSALGDSWRGGGEVEHVWDDRAFLGLCCVWRVQYKGFASLLATLANP